MTSNQQAPSGGRPLSDFSAAAAATLRQLHTRLGMDMWALARHDGDDYVVLSALDTGGIGVSTGDVLAWSDTFCAATQAGDAPRFAAEVDDVPGWRHAKQVTNLPFRSYLTVPLTAPDGAVLGALCAGSRTPVGAGVEDHMPEVELAAGLLGTVLDYELRLQQEARRTEHAESAAHSDALTGLGNRRAWDDAVSAEEARAQRLGSTASVLVLDLDGLKEVNDTVGHSAGDALLVRLADVLRAQLRPEDFSARLGGDEFAVLLPGADASGATRVVDRLAAALRDKGVDASIGAASRRAATGLKAAWDDADAAMYVDKAARAARRAAPLPTATDPSRDALFAELAAEVSRGPASEQINRLLEVARRQLGMEAAAVGRLHGQRWTVQHVAAAPGLPALTGFSWNRAETYCQQVLDGRLPPVVPDTAANPITAQLPITRALGLGAYAGVAIHRPDGSVYGTLCTLSRTAQAEIGPRDADVLTVLAEALSDLVTREEEYDRDRHEVLARLDLLHGQGGPQPVYQPILQLDTLVVAGNEALSRFPTGTPDVWFADAARVGAGEDLELAAVHAALRHQPRTPGFLSVNVSPTVATSPALARALEGQDLRAVVLEITEHEQVDDYPTLLRHLAPLRDAGVRLAVDDAGAGFASMRHVLALAPEFIKLDLSLIRDVHRDPTKRALTAAMNAFARQIGAHVVAEGIETARELECLQQLGVSHGQGYHLGRPAPSVTTTPAAAAPTPAGPPAELARTASELG